MPDTGANRRRPDLMVMEQLDLRVQAAAIDVRRQAVSHFGRRAPMGDVNPVIAETLSRRLHRDTEDRGRPGIEPQAVS